MTGDYAPARLDDQARTIRLWVNWVAALLTAGGAALVMVFATGAVVSTAACSAGECPDLGPNAIMFGVMYYGPPVVAAVTILLSFVTAGRPRGFIVPLVGWCLIAVDVLTLVIAFRR